MKKTAMTKGMHLGQPLGSLLNTRSHYFTLCEQIRGQIRSTLGERTTNALDRRFGLTEFLSLETMVHWCLERPEIPARVQSDPNDIEDSGEFR